MLLSLSVIYSYDIDSKSMKAVSHTVIHFWELPNIGIGIDSIYKDFN